LISLAISGSSLRLMQIRNPGGAGGPGYVKGTW